MNNDFGTPLNTTVEIQRLLDRIRDGDSAQVEVLFNLSLNRLTLLAKKISSAFIAVKRFEQTDDVLQNSLVRLWKAFERHRPETPLDFHRLAASVIRRELIDLSRHYYGAEGMGANLARTAENAIKSDFVSPAEAARDQTSDPKKLERWTDFHEYVDSLEQDEQTLFDLMWYQGLSLENAALLLNTSERTVRRRWKESRLKAQKVLLEGS